MADLPGLTLTMGDDVPTIDLTETAAPIDGVPVIAEDDAARLPRGAAMQADGTVRLTLSVPVTLKFRAASGGAVMEERYADLTLRRLTGKDLRQMQAAEPEDRAVVLIGLSAGIRRSLMELLYDRMDARDCRALADVLDFFSESGATTGR